MRGGGTRHVGCGAWSVSARGRLRRGILGPVAQCRGRRGAGDGDEDLHPRGHGGDDATCLWTRPSYHRDRLRPSRAAPARRFVRSVILLTQTRVYAWAWGDGRGLSPSPSPGCSSRKSWAWPCVRGAGSRRRRTTHAHPATRGHSAHFHGRCNAARTSRRPLGVTTARHAPRPHPPPPLGPKPSNVERS